MNWESDFESFPNIFPQNNRIYLCQKSGELEYQDRPIRDEWTKKDSEGKNVTEQFAIKLFSYIRNLFLFSLINYYQLLLSYQFQIETISNGFIDLRQDDRNVDQFEAIIVLVFPIR